MSPSSSAVPLTPDFYARSLYVHWPFCLSKCPYCDFNSHVNRLNALDYEQWRQAFKISLFFIQEHYLIQPLETIFFGGGTPSLMPAFLVADILSDISEIIGIKPDAEITLEANPTSSEASKFQAYAAAGINRLSMGLQSLNDIDLKFLGRTHTAQEARNAFKMAHQYFKNISFDLIYARQNQTMTAWQAELEQALELAGQHISLYQLTIEPNTMFQSWYQRGKISLPPDDLASDMYLYTSERLAQSGYRHYEISNFAQNNKESKHNLAYWQYRPYIGIGAGAHGRLYDKKHLYHAMHTRKLPFDWLSTVLETKQPAFAESNLLSHQEQALERLLMGMRLETGVHRRDITPLNLCEQKINHYQQEGYLVDTSDSLIATPKGRVFLDYLLSEIIL